MSVLSQIKELDKTGNTTIRNYKHILVFKFF